MLKAIIGKLKKKKDNDVDANVAWLEHNNNKCYTSAFRYIYCIDLVDVVLVGEGMVVAMWV